MTREELDNLVTEMIPDNNTGAVTPFNVRAVFSQMIKSIQQTNLAEVTANLPLKYDSYVNLFTIIKADATHDGYLTKEDWAKSVGRAPANVFKFVQKGFGNSNLAINEIGDIFSGWSNDGTIRISEGIWKGGALTDSDSFTPIIQTEIET